MPIVDISLLAGRRAEHKQAIADAVHDAMVETLGLPEDDYFVLFHEHAPDAFYVDRGFYGIERTDDALIVRITLRDRGTDSKRELYRAIAGRLRDDAGVRVQDVFISLISVPNENWSFGNGEAQLAEQPAPW
jgi:4-oxalocrotonate tautomerase